MRWSFVDKRCSCTFGFFEDLVTIVEFFWDVPWMAFVAMLILGAGYFSC